MNADMPICLQGYGNLVIDKSNFTNTTSTAIRLVFPDAGLTPNQTTISNCLFQNNNNSAVDFQGSTIVGDQFFLNVLLINNTFLNNHNQNQCKIIILGDFNDNIVSGGAISFNTIPKGILKIIGSTFINNTVTKSGGAVHIEQGGSGLEITLINNNFDSNSAFSGGAVDFRFMNGGIVALQNNTYKNNKALFGKRDC